MCGTGGRCRAWRSISCAASTAVDHCAGGLAHGNTFRQGCCSMRRKTGWESNGPMCWRSRDGMSSARSAGVKTPGPWKGWNSGPKILTDRPVYGASLIAGSMGFAPVNEMGVVYLFGGMAPRAGLYCSVDGNVVSRLRGLSRGGAGPVAAGCGLSLNSRPATLCIIFMIRKNAI